MKIITRAAALLLSAFCLSAALISCKEQGDGAEDSDTSATLGTMPEYEADKISSYVKPFEYEGLTVYAEVGETRQEALWSAITESVEIIEYPEAQVEYYFSQERAKYSYYAKRDGIEYEALISALGVTEESMRERAKDLVRDDLALRYIINEAGIVLTDGEKAKHTDKYAERLSEIYGCDKEYVKNNMAEQMYEQMLSDKTMEYLLGKNTIYTSMSK